MPEQASRDVQAISAHDCVGGVAMLAVVDAKARQRSFLADVAPEDIEPLGGRSEGNTRATPSDRDSAASSPNQSTVLAQL